MPRAKNQGSSEPKRRSRTGCWPCKSRKVKCGEERPFCQNCLKTGDTCDYKIRLNWEGRRIKRRSGADEVDGEFLSPTLFSNEFIQTQAPYTTTVVVKKKAKSMDDAFSLDRTPADIRFAAGVETIDTTTTTQYSGTAQSPSSIFSINEEAITSLSEQSDTLMEPYYLEQAPSPGDMQWSSTWNNAGVMMGCMTSTSPQLSRVASCTSDEMALKSIWVDPAAVETSDRRPSVDDTGTDAVECPTRLSYMAQVGYSSAPTCSMMCLVSGKPWMMSMGDMNGTLTGTGNFDMVPEQAAAATEIPAWILRSDYQQTINSLPKGIAPIPDKLKDETNMMQFYARHCIPKRHSTEPDVGFCSCTSVASLALMDKRVESMRAQNGKNEELSFIFSWFSYLDAMGQISTSPFTAGIPEQTGPFDLLQRINVEDEEEFDCVMGFTTRCGQLLAELASLIRQCPSVEQTEDTTMQEAALDLESRFKESMTKPVKVCHHLRKNKIDMRSLTEMDAANQAFHWAGAVYLRRRILRKGSGDEEVQDGVQRIWECIQHIRREKEADTACLFPLFIAGCETNDDAQRKLILARLKSAEKSGMKQVKRARKLMESSWRDGQPWYSLIQDEFLG
ncbi:hypothetical protein LMH87_005181 [Akanthomyces muscarius]|uniref:Zn(2)-C6 fungal-type domain-containing protein n=1 Tax=Akanthomyces muscarius TaxID=2231603 RepID=A0A9W8QL89_AKAMU|nr:hypothetical protein LMH87_005181 [Akanthomyces muscarius]KAJ4163453.1 hypothetical protein LMH87_005181 [Akanthomyces muscarius]